MTDIVERLRNDDVVWGVRPSLAFEAADEIEKLRKERNRLREAMVEIVYLIGDSDRRQEIMDIAKPHAIQHLAALKEKE